MATSTTNKTATTRQTLRTQNVKWEWNRKLFHSSIGFLVLILNYFNVHQETVLKMLYPVTLVYGYLDFMRFMRADWNLQFTRWLSIGMRPAEIDRLQLTSTLYYLFGACTVLLYFERQVCILALLMLAWGDTAAAFGGRLYKTYFLSNGKKKDNERKKTWAGSISAFGAGSLIVALVGRGSLFNLVMGGVVCAVGEYISVFGLDDNLTMPIICAALLAIFRIN